MEELRNRFFSMSFLRFVLLAGPHGATMTEIFGAFQLNSKSNGHRVKSMHTSNEVIMKFDNVGRSVVNRCIAKCYLDELLLTSSGGCSQLPSVKAPHGELLLSICLLIDSRMLNFIVASR